MIGEIQTGPVDWLDTLTVIDSSDLTTQTGERLTLDLTADETESQDCRQQLDRPNQSVDRHQPDRQPER